MLADLLLNPDLQPAKDDPARDSLIWAREFINVDMLTAVIGREQVECYLSYVDCDFNEVTFGRADVAALDHDGSVIIYDYKSGATGDHGAQLRLYALMAMRKWGAVTATCYTLYGATQYARREEVDIISCQREFDEIRAAVEDPNKKPSRCDWCHWCDKFETCPAVTKQVYEIARAESLDVASPVQIAQALEIASVAEKWAKAIKAKARAAILDGADVPDWRVRHQEGDKYIADIPKAFSLAGIDQGDFLAACSASLPKLSDVIAKRDGMSKKAAREALENMIGICINRKADKNILERAKGK
jgi:hypothetical protein